jgi:hypothetical protein
MEKDQDIESTKQQEEPNGEVIEQSHEPEIHTDKVVVKKSGGGLALLMALIALGISGYLFYKDWLAAREDAGQNKSGEFLQQLNTHKSMSAKNSLEFQQQLDQVSQSVKQVEAELNDLKTDISTSSNESSNNLGELVSFDNSANLAAIEALQSELTTQNQLLLSMQSQLAAQPTTPTTQEFSSDYLAKLQRSTAVQALVSAQTLLESGQIVMASTSLENYLLGATIDDNYQRKIQNKVNQIKDIKQPDSIKLTQRLSHVGKAIKDLTIPTENTENSDTSWYDRFISVKKINEGSQVDSSFELLSLKAELSNRLNAAKLLLTLKDQQGWQHALNQAADLLQQNMPQQQALVNQLQKLAGEPIVATVPENIALMKLVDELKGMR